MLTFEEYIEKVDPVGDSQYLEEFYRDLCIQRMHKYFDIFIHNRLEEKTSKEELYNWCIALEIIFNIQTDRDGHITKKRIQS